MIKWYTLQIPEKQENRNQKSSSHSIIFGSVNLKGKINDESTENKVGDNKTKHEVGVNGCKFGMSCGFGSNCTGIQHGVMEVSFCRRKSL